MRRFSNSRSIRGFTLVELMVGLAVLAILVAMALPSFADFAQRSALRGAADNVVGVIAAAKEDAIKRDSMVRVDFKTVGSGFCMGAEPVASAAVTGCDCSSGTACTIARFPASAGELRSVVLDGAPSFGGTAPLDKGFTVDPKTAMLADFVQTGYIQLKVPRGYGVRVSVNAMGRTNLCTPSGRKPLAGVASC